MRKYQQRDVYIYHCEIVGAQVETLKLIYGGPSQRQASDTNQRIKDLRQGHH